MISAMRWIAATLLGIGLAFAVQRLIAMPDVALVPVAISLSYGFENLFASERLRRWWNGSA